MTKPKKFLLFALLFVGLASWSQSKKAYKQFEQAKNYYQLREYQQSEDLLLEVLEKNPEWVDAWLMLGDIYRESSRSRLALEAYDQTIALDPDFYPVVYYVSAELNFELGFYYKALERVNQALTYEKLAEPILQEAKSLKNRLEKAILWVENPVEFKPVNMGEALNTSNHEYVNAQTLDRSLLLFTRKKTETREQPAEFFFQSRLVEGIYEPAQVFEPIWTEHGNLGGLSISVDGREVYFNGCYWSDGFGSCDIYHSVLANGRWSYPQNLGNQVNSGRWDAQPCLSADDKWLIFCSRRPGGLGGSDLYISFKLENGNWSKAVNMGKPLNTPMDEMAPFLHADGRSLYFSSNGHTGLGGMDLFLSRFEEPGTWSEPVNLGYPVNTFEDEINLVVDRNGADAFLSANRTEGFGGFDIYRFQLPAEQEPFPVSYVAYELLDASDDKPIWGKASWYRRDLEDKLYEKTAQSQLIVLPVGHTYALIVESKGYLMYSMEVDMEDVFSADRPMELVIRLQPLRSGSNTVLRNVLFETDKSSLLSISFPELDKVVQLMQENSGLRLMIEGHTDNTGTEDHNLKLSEERAKAVYDYLTAAGIEVSRLEFKGYGSARPLNDNTTEAQKALNRRTEIRILD